MTNSSKQDEIQLKEITSAQNVDDHLQGLEGNTHLTHAEAQILEEQVFSDEELAGLINTERLNTLLGQADSFLTHINDESGY